MIYPETFDDSWYNFTQLFIVSWQIYWSPFQLLYTSAFSHKNKPSNPRHKNNKIWIFKNCKIPRHNFKTMMSNEISNWFKHLSFDVDKETFALSKLIPRAFENCRIFSELMFPRWCHILHLDHKLLQILLFQKIVCRVGKKVSTSKCNQST